MSTVDKSDLSKDVGKNRKANSLVIAMKGSFTAPTNFDYKTELIEELSKKYLVE